jgi:hypothetical protein
MTSRFAFASAAALALAACGPPAPTAPPASPAAPPVSPPASEPLSQSAEGPIPAEFRGAWAIDAADCEKDPGLTRIAISQNAVSFYEGRAQAVSASVPHEGALAMEADHSAEGQTTRETHVLAVGDDGKLAYQRRGQTFTYARCP